MTHHTTGALRVQVAAEITGAVDAILAPVAIVGAALDWRHDKPRAITWAVGLGLTDAAVLSSLFMTRDARSAVLEGVVFAVPTLLALGVAVDDDPYPVPRLTAGSLTAAYGATTALTIVNRALTPTRFSELRVQQARLEQATEGLSEQELRRMHYTLLGARGPLPHWLIGLPLIVGGASAAVPLFDRSYDKDEQVAAGVLGAIGLFTGVLLSLPSSVDSYESDVQTLGISVAVSPSGVGMAGIF